MVLTPAIASLLDGRELPVVLNRAASGPGSAAVPALLESLRALGLRPRPEQVEPRKLADSLKRCLKQGARVLVVGGGDGSISTAADQLAGSDAVLVPLPLGTRNHFAQRYGLATPAAVELALRTGTVVTLPLGAADRHHFLNNASFGFYPRMVARREPIARWIGKWPGSLLAGLIVLLQCPLLELELEVQGSIIRRPTAALWVGIGRDSLRLPEPGDTDREGRFLEIVLPRTVSRTGLLRLALRLLMRLRQLGRPNDPELEIVRACAFKLTSAQTLPAALDGELACLASPLHFRYQENALRVLCLVAPEPPGQGAS